MNYKSLSLFFYIFTIFFLNAQEQIGSDINGEAAYDQSGYSVSMPDANTIAIGAPYHDITPTFISDGIDAGNVRIFIWNGTSWLQKGQDINGEMGEDHMGISVSMPDANTVAIGSPENDGNGSNAGDVSIYSWNGSIWSQKGSDIMGDSNSDKFGHSVSMPDDNTVAIGAPLNDAGGFGNSGHVKIFNWNGTSWVQKGLDIEGDNYDDRLGFSVCMPDANTVAIGAPENDDNGGNSGQVRVFKWNGTSWLQKGQYINGTTAGDQTGFSISMPNANTIAIGAPFYDLPSGASNSGQVRVFEWNGTAWIPKGQELLYLAYNGISNEFFGHSISMPDPNTLAIGVPSSLVGIVHVLKWNGLNWIRKGLDIWGQGVNHGHGSSVSMPDDNTVGFGVPQDNWGISRVYSVCANSESYATDVQNACDYYLWIDGNVYTTNNNSATWTLTNAIGCDSIITLDLTILNSSTGTDVQTQCDSYTWIDGNTYNSSTSGINSPTWLLTNSAGCDSIVSLDLTILNSTTGTDTHTKCDSYTWIDGNTYSSSNNTATWILTNTAGCDSVVTLDLTIVNSNTGTDNQTSCDAYTWIDGNTYTSNNNTATYTLQNISGCDSVITLDLIINSVSDNTVSQDGATLTSNNTLATYQWIDCDNDNDEVTGATSQSFTPSTDGNYAVVVTENGCTDTSNCVNVSTVSIDVLNGNLQYSVYPNPTKDKVNIEFTNKQKNIMLLIYNTSGQKVFQKTYKQRELVKVNLPRERGLYTMELQTESGKATFQVIKE